MALSQELVDHGSARLGTESTPLRLEVTNQGEEALRIDQVLVTGEHSVDFPLRQETCGGRELAEGTSCFVTVGFRPAGEGGRRARLELIGNATNSPLAVALLGIGTAPRLRIEPDSLEFSTRTVGTASPTRSLQLENVGSAAVELGWVELEGPGAADFVLTADRCSGKVLEAGARCQIAVAFVPSRAGSRKASLRVEGTAGESFPKVILSGEGLPQEPTVRLAPETLVVGAVAVGEVSPPQVVEIWNDGNGPLEVSSIRAVDARSLVGKESGRGGLEVLRETCTREPVLPAKRCRIEVRLAPLAEGESRAFLEIRHSAGDGLHRVAVSGQGVAPHVEVVPSRLSFGQASVSIPTEPRSVVVRSTGSSALEVGEMKLEGADARSFELRPTSCSGVSLPPDTECRVELLFSARREGPHRAELVIDHGAAGAEERVPVNGIGVAARLRVDRERLDFGEVRQGAAAVDELILSNTGRALLRIRKVTVDRREKSGFEVGTDRCSGTALEPGTRCVVEISLDTRSPGSRSGRLLIDHDGAAGVAEVLLSGLIVSPPKPVLGELPASLEFDVVGLGERSSVKILVLRSIGTGPVTLGKSWITGAQALDFHQVGSDCGAGTVVPAGATCEVSLRFIPAGEGVRRAEWMLEHDGPGSPAVVRLQGTGGI